MEIRPIYPETVIATDAPPQYLRLRDGTWLRVEFALPGVEHHIDIIDAADSPELVEVGPDGHAYDADGRSDPALDSPSDIVAAATLAGWVVSGGSSSVRYRDAITQEDAASLHAEGGHCDAGASVSVWRAIVLLRRDGSHETIRGAEREVTVG